MWRKGLSDSALCPYGCQSEENIMHMLFSCMFITDVWKFLGIGRQRHYGPESLVQAILQPPPCARSLKKIDWVALLIAITWHIWLARNKKTFEDRRIPQRRVAENIIQDMKIWALRTKKRSRRASILEWLTRNSNLASD